MRIIVTLLWVGLVTSSSWAAVLSGRATLSSYVWNHTEIDSSETRHLQNSGTLGLKLARIGGKDLEITTTLRGSYDKRNQGDDVDDYRVHDLMARWKNLAGVADLTVGRQRIFWPTASVAVDGASADVDILNALQVGGYIGTLAPEDGHFRPTDYDEGHAFGIRLVCQTKAVGKVSLSFAERRHAASYNGTSVNTLASRVAGIDWRRPIIEFGTVYGHLTYDLPRRHIGRAQFSVRWDAMPTVSIQTEYRYRRPSIAYNSIFWVFGQSDYAEGRARVYWRPTHTWTFSIGLATINVSGDNAERFDLGVSHKYFSVMLHGKSGVAGNTVGVSGDATYPLNGQWTIRGGSNYSSYELIEDQAESNMEAAIWGGLRWQAWSQSTIDIEAQYLTRDIVTALHAPTDKSDVRLLARVSWWFFQRVGEQSGQ